MRGQSAIELSDSDLTLLIEACQGQASRYARDADYERKPVIRQAPLAGAAELERLAERLRRSGHGSARMAARFDGRSAEIEKLTDNYDNPIVV